MSDRARDQFLDTFKRLQEAVDETKRGDMTHQRRALQEVIGLCESLRASSVGWSTMLGWSKRIAQEKG